MKAEEFYKQRSNSIRELWALSPKQIEYIALIMEEYAALRQPLVNGELADFARFLSEEYSIEIHERIIDEWNKYYSANYR